MSSLGSSEAASPASRRDLFKPSVQNVAGQRRRQQAGIIGKERRDAAVRAKRMRRMSVSSDGDIMDDVETPFCDENSSKVLEESAFHAVQEFKSAISTLGKGAAQRKMEAIRNLRRLLSCNSLPPLDAAIEAGVVPSLVDCLAFGSSDEQLLEAAWCLTNIASGDSYQTRAVMPALPFLIAHLGERSAVHVAEQCAWAIGNVAGEGEDLRETLLAQGALFPLGRLLLSNRSSTARTAAWALSNLIKGPSPAAATELMKLDGLPEAIVRHMKKGDDELAVEVAWVVVYLTALSEMHSEVLIRVGLLAPLVGRLASSDQLSLLTPVLRSIGNFVAGDNAKTDAVLEAGKNIHGGVIGALAHCLMNEHRTLQKEAAWAVSNIAAGSLQHKQMLFCSEVLSPLLHLMATAVFDVRKEVAYALGNLCVTPMVGSVRIPEPILEHLTVLIDRGCLLGFISLVRSPDLEASRLGLQFLELVLRGLPNGQGTKLVEKVDGIAAMEALEYHENVELRNMANELIERYFGEDYGIEEEYGPGVTVVKGADDVSDYPPWRKGGITNS
eukprot:c27487_g1_i5 orf=639-2306(-)